MPCPIPAVAFPSVKQIAVVTVTVCCVPLVPVAKAKGLEDLSKANPATTSSMEQTDSTRSDANSDGPSSTTSSKSTEPAITEPKASPEGEQKTSPEDTAKGAVPSSTASENLGETTIDTTTTVAEPPGMVSTFLADKLAVGTSFGWLVTFGTEGQWRSGGGSDLTVTYALPIVLPAQMSLHGSYRYAPTTIAGTQDRRSYRGITESHLLGAQLVFPLADALDLLVSSDLGYMAVHLDSLDGQFVDQSHSADSAVFACGAGTSWQVPGLDDTVTVGSKVVAEFGAFPALRVSATSTFLF